MGGEPRSGAIEAANELFRAFDERFDATECRTLIGYDLSQPAEMEAFHQEYAARGLEHQCNHQVRYAIEHCLAKYREMAATE